MRPILVSIVVAAVVAWCGSLTFARAAEQVGPRPHKHIATTVEKVESGLVWFKPVAGLEHRAVSPPQGRAHGSL
jgi:hypothetical protein